MIVNKIFSKLNKDNYIEDNQDSFNKFSSLALSILSKIIITKEAKNLLKLFMTVPNVQKKFYQTYQK